MTRNLMNSDRRAVLAGLAASTLLPLTTARAAERYITVVSTTTTQDSGILSHLGPVFTARTGIGIRFVIFGSGQALDTGRRGDADVVLSHLRAEEERFVADGFGVARQTVMYNDFVLVGPRQDPAGVAGLADNTQALARIRAGQHLFISRGDRSGTHAVELALWRRAGVDVASARGRWYREIGQGQGAALNMAASLDAYVLTDRGTWLSFRNRAGLTMLIEGDPKLRNQYAVILVNPTRHPHVKREDGQAFIDWLTGPDGQAAINAYRVNGERLFVANAREPGA